MPTITGQISEIRDYLASVLSIGWEGNPAYEGIIRSSVEGTAFGKKDQIDIAFIAALTAVPKAEDLFHPRGIVVKDLTFGPSSVSMRSEKAQISRFDLARTRFPLPLAFRNCTFAETLDLRRAHLASLDFTGSTLPALMLQGARLDGPLILDDIHT